jgi:hypothetical protein
MASLPNGEKTGTQLPLYTTIAFPRATIILPDNKENKNLPKDSKPL